MKLDPSQSLAVNTTGTNILVSASAGAGKTGVLVSRLMKRCLVDYISLDEILAVTFTAAAAGEMKNRVAQRLQEEYQKENADKDWIEKQMVLLASANITTIDAFCKTIIEKYYNVIGLDPAMPQNILDDGKKEILFEEAFENALKEMDKTDHSLLVKTLEYTSSRSEDYDSLKNILNKMITVSECFNDPDKWLDSTLEKLNPDSCMHNEEIRHLFYADIKIKLLAIKSSLSLMHSYAILDEKLSIKIDDITSAQNKLETVIETMQNDDYALFVDRLLTFSVSIKTPTNSHNKEYTNARKSFTANLSKLSESIFDLKTYKNDSKEIIPIASMLIELSKKTRQNYTFEKIKNVSMDFSDMERYAYEILCANNSFVSKLYQKHFKEVMVDEFQDTSSLQDEIIKKIAQPGTIFRVGDVKQSIYRFRQAKPDLMRSLFKKEDEKIIVLEHNYRSKNNIVDFCNALFKRVMNLENCKDTYDEKDIVTVGTNAQILSTSDPVKFILVENDPKITAITKKQAKAYYIANKIQELHETGIPYNNFAVLVRSHNDKSSLRYAFDLFQIPYDIDAREGFFKTPICMTILALLKAILNPEDSLSLLAVVTSKLYNMQDAELAKLKIEYKTVLNGLKNTRRDLFEDLKDFQEIADTKGITALLTAIAQKNDFYNQLSSKDQANFDFLFEKAIKIESNSHSIYDLLEFMDASEDEKSSEAMSRNRDDDVVTVTTIHQSKGLQYKIVFLWSTSQNKMMDFSSPVLVDESLGLGFEHLDMPYRTVRPTMLRKAIEYKQNVEDLEESSRLLYVALTRAEQKLYIVDNYDEKFHYKKDFNLSTLNERKGMSGLILSALDYTPDLFEIEHFPVERILVPKRQDTKSIEQELPVFTLDILVHSTPILPSATEHTGLPSLSIRSGGKSYGTKIHEVLSSLENRVWSLEDLKKYSLSDTAKKHILAFSKSSVYLKALKMNIYKEYPFFVKKDSAYIQGVIDFLAMDENEILLVDFKTDSTQEENLISSYQKQIETYALALSILYPNKKIHAYIYSLYLDKSIEISVS